MVRVRKWLFYCMEKPGIGAATCSDPSKRIVAPHEQWSVSVGKCNGESGTFASDSEMYFLNIQKFCKRYELVHVVGFMGAPKVSGRNEFILDLCKKIKICSRSVYVCHINFSFSWRKTKK